METFILRLIGLVAVCVVVVAHSETKEGRKVIDNCSNLNRQSYCSSCFNVTRCENGVDTTTDACDVETQACHQNEFDSYCGPRDEIEGCTCPTTVGDPEADLYDPQKYFFCLAQGTVPGECGRTQIFDVTSKVCVDLYASTPFVPQQTHACASDETSYTVLDCTSYQECVVGNREVFDCDNGDIFNPDTNSCELYIPFTCTGKANGAYPDSVRCDLARVCEGGSEATIIPCSEGTVYDPVAKNCTTDLTACTLTGCYIPIPDYVVCVSGNETYPINADSYYKCTLNASGGFEPIPTECEEGSYFDADLGSCVPYSHL